MRVDDSDPTGDRSRSDVPVDGGIVHSETGLPRLLHSKCTTCIYRPGNLMHLAPGRREQMERDAVANGAWIICHATLPIYPSNPGAQAICRGFFDVRGHDSWGIRLALALGGPTEVDPPDTPPPPQGEHHDARGTREVELGLRPHV